MTCLGSFRCIYESTPNVKIPSYMCFLHKYFQNRNMFGLIFTRIFPTKLCFKEWRASIRNYTRKQEIRLRCNLLTAT